MSDWAEQQKHFAGDDEFPQWVNANTVVLVKSSYKKDWKWFGKALLASVIPFGTFYMDKYWKKEAEAPAA